MSTSDTAFLLGAEITDTNLVSFTVAEPDTTRVMPDGTVGEVAFNPATNYAVSAYAYSTVTHRIYKNAAGGVNATQPHLAPTRWTDMGPTNRWAWTDWYRSTKTTSTSSMTLVVNPGSITDLVIRGMEGITSVRVQVFETPGGNVLFDRTYSTLYWTGGGDPWVTYYFDLPQLRVDFEVEGLQPVGTAQVQVDLIGSSGQPVAVGAILFGRYQSIGRGLFGANARQRPFRRFETDDFGSVTLARRGLATDIQATAIVDTADANAIKRAVDAVVDTPVALRITRSGNYDFLRGFGLLDVAMEASGPNHVSCSLELKGFK